MKDAKPVMVVFESRFIFYAQSNMFSENSKGYKGMKNAIIDYLEFLQMSGVEDWGPFSYDPEDYAVPEEREQIPQVETIEKVETESAKPSIEKTTQSNETVVEISQKSQSPLIIPTVTQNRTSALAVLAAEVAQCEKCPELAASRTQTVFGTGNPFSELVFLGEAPGADEDKQGVPFVGRAGQLLTDMITKGMKLKREDVYICNILRCRPPKNRNPEPIEASKCRHFLDRTLEIIRPKFICCLGAVAAQNLLSTVETIGNLRGKVIPFHEMKVVCTYHPAFLLRTPSAKAKTWEDLQLLMKEMGIPIK